MDKFKLDGHKLTYHPLEIAAFYKGESVNPVYVEISPTAHCNHRCLFCHYNYLGHKGKAPKGRMISLLHELKRAGTKSVVFAGIGEPLLNMETVDAIEKAKELGIDSGMSTNGALIIEDDIDRLASSLTWVRFSFNGCSPENYALVHKTNNEDYNKVINNIKLLVEAKKRLNADITIGIQFILLPENAEGAASQMKLMKEIGVDYFVVKHFYSHEMNEYKGGEIASELIENLKKQAAELSDESFSCVVRDEGNLEKERAYDKCYGLPFIVYIREDGEVYTCFSYQHDSKTSLGNINDSDFNTIWCSPSKQEVFDYINDKIDKNKCQPNCRHHQINNYLWELRNPSIGHINFI